MRVALAFLLLLAQPAASFDVVSIKPVDAKADAPFRGTGLQGNRWIGTHVTLRELIQDSRESDGFDMPGRVGGGPAWLDKDQFDLVATSTSAPTQARLEAMIRAMLADRFHVVSHIEKRTLPAYELVLVRRDSALGPTLRRTATGCAPQCGLMMAFGPVTRMTSASVDMTRLGSVLSTVLHQAIIDRTGLTGQFELSLEFAPTDAAAPSDAPSIFTAVEEQLGLKLRSVKAALDVLVVDSARKPSFD